MCAGTKSGTALAAEVDCSVASVEMELKLEALSVSKLLDSSDMQQCW